MTTKVAVITGASSGIGKATVKEFLKLRYTVYAASRRLEAMEDIKAKGAKVLHLDLTDSDSIKNCISTVLSESERLDVLVNNAGYGSYGAVEDVPIEEARRQFEVNLFGAAEMIQQVLPQMRKQRFGKIVNVSSIGGKVWSLLGAWYQATKFALEGFSDCLRNELRPLGIDVILIEPGAVKTDWSTTAVENLLKFSSESAYHKLAKIAAKFYPKIEKNMGAEPDVIAKTIIKSISASRPKARYVAPDSVKIIVFLRWLLSDSTFDKLMSKMFRIPKHL